MQRPERSRQLAHGGQAAKGASDATGVHVDFRVRTDAPSCVGDVQDRTRERLQRLESDGQIDSYTVTVWDTWPLASPRREDETASSADEIFDQFRSWAGTRDVSLQPAFRTREIDAMLVEGIRTELVPPMFCVAVYSDDSLDTVFPHADRDGIITVDDGLDRLAAGEPVGPAGGEEA